MAYKPINDFDVTDPEELRRDLQQMDKQIALALADTPLQPFGSVRRIRTNDNAKIRELLVVDTSAGSLTVILPKISDLAGLSVPVHIGIVMTSASNTLLLQCVGTDKINRGSSASLTGYVGLSAYVIFDGLEYWL